MGTFVLIEKSSMIWLLLVLLSSVHLVLSIPITDRNVENVLTEKFTSHTSEYGQSRIAKLKLVTPRKTTRTGRQSNYPLMIYGGCYPPGQAGGWGWGYPPYSTFRKQDGLIGQDNVFDFTSLCKDQPGGCEQWGRP
ncbi:uncharacterized protein LOC118437227 [Folsomia candida]|uniref:uncharacterized protein LOC118437227 n=1 Tax=Folsomia candida TaxID=158441 RepID=UPI001604D196|nr:uncharacterized protein LOC118437227 [Folsomia candida]